MVMRNGGVDWLKKSWSETAALCTEGRRKREKERGQGALFQLTRGIKKKKEKERQRKGPHTVISVPCLQMGQREGREIWEKRKKDGTGWRGILILFCGWVKGDSGQGTVVSQMHFLVRRRRSHIRKSVDVVGRKKSQDLVLRTRTVQLV